MQPADSITCLVLAEGLREEKVHPAGEERETLGGGEGRGGHQASEVKATQRVKTGTNNTGRSSEVMALPLSSESPPADPNPLGLLGQSEEPRPTSCFRKHVQLRR